MLAAINTIGAQQASPTENTLQAAVHLSDYATTHPNARIRYTSLGMTMHIHSNASFMAEPQARSRTGGHFFLSDKPSDPSKPPTTDIPLNGP
eukprot:13640475-Ditylum_brightwellii.AAC.1